MLLIVRIVTIISLLLGLIAGGWLIVAGLLEDPRDMEAVWLGTSFLAFYLAAGWLLYRGYKKKHGPIQWVALIFSLLPLILLLVLVQVAELFD